MSLVKEFPIDKLINMRFFLGTLKSDWHSNNFAYIIGYRRNYAILDFNSFQFLFKKALSFLEQVLLKGGTLFFYLSSLRGQYKLDQLSTSGPFYYYRSQNLFIVERWMPGLLTNFVSLNQTSNFYDAAKEKLKMKFPSALLTYGVDEENIYLVNEAQKMKVPLWGLIDSSTDSIHFDYFTILSLNDEAVTYFTKFFKIFFSEVEEVLAFNHYIVRNTRRRLKFLKLLEKSVLKRKKYKLGKIIGSTFPFKPNRNRNIRFKRKVRNF